MRLGVCTSVCPDAPLDESVRLASQLGADGIVLWGREPHLPESYDPVRLDAVRRLVARHGLRTAALRTGFRAGAEAPGPRRADEVSQLVRSADALGAQLLTVLADPTTGPDGSVSGHVICELRDLCDRALERGIGVCVEMEADTVVAEADEALSLLERVGRDGLSLAWEPGNGGRFDACVARLCDVAPHLSLAFALNRAAEHGDYSPIVPLSEGAVDYAEVMAALQGFDGWVVLAGALQGAPPERFRLLGEDAAYLRRLSGEA